MRKICMECNDRPAMHWDRSFCEECFRKIFKQKLQEEDRRCSDESNKKNG